MSPIPGVETFPYAMDPWDPDSVESGRYMGSGSDLGDESSDSDSDYSRYISRVASMRLCSLVQSRLVAANGKYLQ